MASDSAMKARTMAPRDTENSHCRLAAAVFRICDVLAPIAIHTVKRRADIEPCSGIVFVAIFSAGSRARLPVHTSRHAVAHPGTRRDKEIPFDPSESIRVS